ncbi:DUF4126 domain-containing protein [Nocardiopsis sp. RSe5-2]|uniref:DUF4126 domain-containing protein n=1 Tax=Nocardiopsis endophytica TaxID=3018445 RepID=A0ABT4UCB4_9ACTN|nr:DUF4126 domain-containing protein [Nocardiopsis endophytica]MDA2814622.1 DUF4126 domain-containing protein [Nocardiopsis endophytica]
MLELLTGAGLASSAGLNAYIPLLAAGLLSRFTPLFELGPSWAWLEHPATLVILGVLLVVELLADKIPAVDSVNDVVQTLIRPTSGGITFGAGASSFTTDMDTGDGSWWPIVTGALIALAFHALKAVSRPVLNTATFGVGGPVVSFIEDGVSAVTSFFAIVLPILVLVVVPATFAVGVWAWRRRRRKKRERAAAEAA